MISNPAIEKGDLSTDLREKVKAYLFVVEQTIRVMAFETRIAPGKIPLLKPCNLVCCLTPRIFCVMLTDLNAAQLPEQVWLGLPDSYTLQDLQQLAMAHWGHNKFFTLTGDAALLDSSFESQAESARSDGQQWIRDFIRTMNFPKAPIGFEFLQPILDDFSADHPEFDKNVFMCMPFREQEHFKALDGAIRASLNRFGLHGCRADDRMYPSDNDLWNNICVYMMGCRYAVCVFEDIDTRQFNPNVAIEYGFLQALNRRTLVLKEQRLPIMPSDLVGKLYRTFDQFNITSSVQTRVAEWAERDLGLRPVQS